jgi:hypothetical protein
MIAPARVIGVTFEHRSSVTYVFSYSSIPFLATIRSNVAQTTHAVAIKYAADTTLVQNDEITIRELVQLLAERVDEVDEAV